MIIFKLPDLGEGLADAQIRRWYVKVGDTIKMEQPLVSVETAKAIVDIPAPFAGIVEKLFGKAGDIIETGKPLMAIRDQDKQELSADAPITKPSQDAGTVVGTISHSDVHLGDMQPTANSQSLRITPNARLLAKKLGVSLVKLTKLGKLITPDMVKQVASQQHTQATAQTIPHQKKQTPITAIAAQDTESESQTAVALASKLNRDANTQALQGIRLSMFKNMAKAQQQVVPASLHDEADIYHWYGQADITTRVIRAIVAACQVEPILNASLDSDNLSYRLNDTINLGLAVHTTHGLFVPVIKNLTDLNDQQLREKIDHFKQLAQQKNIYQHDLQDATITLSNFGIFAGRFANAIIIPPQVAIVAVGKLRQAIVAMDGTVAIHPVLPISLTFDHRLITGGEAARFFQELLLSLGKS